MSLKQNVSLARSRYLLDHVEAYEQMGGSSEPLLARIGLIPGLLRSPEALVPLHKINEFVRAALEDAGPGLWQHAAPRRLEELGAFGERLARSSSLYEAIKIFLRVVKSECAHLDFFVEQRPGALWWCRGPFDGGDEVLRIHAERYVVQLMLAVVRHWLGPSWLPTELWLQSGPQPQDEVFRAIPRVRYRTRATGFPIPHRQLLTGITSQHRSTPDQAQAVASGGLPEVDVDAEVDLDLDLDHLDLAEGVSRLLEGVLQVGTPSVGQIAELLGTSGRSFQRRLHEMGTTFSDIVAQTRHRLAVEQLEHSNASITAIAQRLGYSDSAHFARAFRRWVGVGPREYRRTSREERTNAVPLQQSG